MAYREVSAPASRARRERERDAATVEYISVSVDPRRAPQVVDSSNATRVMSALHLVYESHVNAKSVCIFFHYIFDRLSRVKRNMVMNDKLVSHSTQWPLIEVFLLLLFFCFYYATCNKIVDIIIKVNYCLYYNRKSKLLLT